MKLLDFDIGINHPLFIIAGPCVVESESLQIETAGFLKELCNKLGVRFIFKSSFDKANRSSADSFRGGVSEHCVADRPGCGQLQIVRTLSTADCEQDRKLTVWKQ